MAYSERQLLFSWRNSPYWARASSLSRFTITLTLTTRDTTSLDELSARCRDLYLTTHNTHNRQASMPPAGFEPATPGSERPQMNIIYARAYLPIKTDFLQEWEGRPISGIH